MSWQSILLLAVGFLIGAPVGAFVTFARLDPVVRAAKAEAKRRAEAEQQAEWKAVLGDVGIGLERWPAP